MHTKPRLLDLFCGAGGCSVGYERAGFEVSGVDILPQPRYPFRFKRDDALGHLRGAFLGFDVVHASPPCQAFTSMNSFGTMHEHPDLLTETLEILKMEANRYGAVYIVENVEGAPIEGVTFCGSSFGLGVRRHRIFASNVPLVPPPCDHGSQPVPIPVVGHGVPSSFRQRHGYSPTVAERREAMGIDWMNRDELAEAIPPAYTEFIGKQVLDFLNERNMPTMESRSG